MIIVVKLVVVCVVFQFATFSFLKYLKAHADGSYLGLFMKLYCVNMVQCSFEHILRASLIGTNMVVICPHAFKNVNSEFKYRGYCYVLAEVYWSILTC
jgi:hypothetical protein